MGEISHRGRGRARKRRRGGEGGRGKWEERGRAEITKKLFAGWPNRLSIGWGVWLLALTPDDGESADVTEDPSIILKGLTYIFTLACGWSCLGISTWEKGHSLCKYLHTKGHSVGSTHRRCQICRGFQCLHELQNAFTDTFFAIFGVTEVMIGLSKPLQ